MLSLLFIVSLSCSVVYASVIVSNDFKNEHWVINTGYAEFAKKITLIPTSATNTSKIIYYKTLPQLGYNTSTVYLYYDINVSWHSESSTDRTFELWLYDGTDDYFIGFNHYNDRYDFRFKVGTFNQYITLSGEMPYKGVIAIQNGKLAILYDDKGNRVTFIEYTSGSSEIKFTNWGFTSFKAITTINTYALATNLNDALLGKSTSETTTTVYAYLPLVIAIAMLGVAISFIKKYVK